MKKFRKSVISLVLSAALILSMGTCVTANDAQPADNTAIIATTNVFNLFTSDPSEFKENMVKTYNVNYDSNNTLIHCLIISSFPSNNL